MQVPDPVPHLRISPEAQANYGGHPSCESSKVSVPPGPGRVCYQARLLAQGVCAIGGPSPSQPGREGLGAATGAARRDRDPTWEAGSVCHVPHGWVSSWKLQLAEVAPHRGLDCKEDPRHTFPFFLPLPQNAGSQLFSGGVGSKNMQPKRWRQ